MHEPELDWYFCLTDRSGQADAAGSDWFELLHTVINGLLSCRVVPINQANRSLSV